jgi:hypothetical protein
MAKGIRTATVNKAIFEAIGIDVRVTNGRGYWYFSSPDTNVGIVLASLETTSVSVDKLSQLSVESWVNEIRFLLKRHPMIELLEGDNYAKWVEDVIQEM